MTRFAAAAVLALLAVPAAAGEAGALSCERAETTADMRICLTRDLRATEKELQRYLEAARREARPPEALEKSQAAWTSYRDAACRAAAGQYEGGSLRPVVALDCLVRLTRERTLELWRAYLANEGTLPEPRSNTVTK